MTINLNFGILFDFNPSFSDLLPDSVAKAHAKGVPLIKAWRIYRRITQLELAARSGVSYPSISRVETGIKNIRKKNTLQKIADALEISIEQLVEYSPHTPGKS